MSGYPPGGPGKGVKRERDDDVNNPRQGGRGRGYGYGAGQNRDQAGGRQGDQGGRGYAGGYDQGYDGGYQQQQGGYGQQGGYQQGGYGGGYQQQQGGYGGGYQQGGYGGGGGGGGYRGGGGGGGYRGGGRGGGGGGRGGGRGGQHVSEQEAQQAVSRVWEGANILAAPSKVGPEETDVTARPDFGTIGEELKVLVNSFSFSFKDCKPVYLYDVKITDLTERKPKSGKLSAKNIERVQQEEDVKAEGKAEGEENVPVIMPHKNVCSMVMKKVAREQKFPPWWYDGQRLLYSTSEGIDPYDGVVELRGEEIIEKPGARRMNSVRFQVTINGPSGDFYPGDEINNALNHVGQVARNTLQSVDVNLRHGATADDANNNRQLGRGIYNMARSEKLSFGVEVWEGYSQSVAVAQDGPLLFMDSAIMGVPVAESLMDWMSIALFRRPGALPSNLSSRDIGTLNREIERLGSRKALTINPKHQSDKLKHKVRGFSEEPASKFKFTITTTGQELTVEEYFRSMKGITLKYPHLPCAMVGSKEPSKRNAFPVELCQILPENRPLTADETTTILKKAATRPDAREQRIKQLFAASGLTRDPTVAAAGIKFDSADLKEVNARQLPNPYLQYDGTVINPGNSGEWNIQNVRLLAPPTISSYAVVNFAREHNQTANVMQELIRECHSKGITVPEGRPDLYVQGNPGDLHGSLQKGMDAAKRVFGKPADILFVIQQFQRELYTQVKKICDVDLGVHSQLFAWNKLSGGRGGMGGKLAGVTLKLCNKLGGVSWNLYGGLSTFCPTVKQSLQLPGGREPLVMMMGADISHGQTGDRGGARAAERAKAEGRPLMPSVAAVVGSTNIDCTRFISRVYAQEPFLEVVEDLGKATTDLVAAFWKANGKQYPDVIIMFRDGCSEGQFKIVLEDEAKKIMKACSRYKTPDGLRYEPKLVFVTIQKRHAIRLFPLPNASKNRSGNVNPGTVVDSGICDPVMFDYVLNSHAGIQGTNKPAKYTVLRDDLGFTADTMQTLTFWLCHTFHRCMRSVSACPPAYYAHVAALRGAAYLEQTYLPPADTESLASGSSRGERWEWRMMPVHKNLLNSMYFI